MEEHKGSTCARPYPQGIEELDCHVRLIVDVETPRDKIIFSPTDLGFALGPPAMLTGNRADRLPRDRDVHPGRPNAQTRWPD